MGFRGILFSFVGWATLACQVQAETITLSAADVVATLQGESDGGAASVLSQRVSEALRSLGLEMKEGGLLTSQRLTGIPLSEGCTREATLDQLDLDAQVDDTSALTISINHINEPVIAGLQLALKVQGQGAVSQRFGARLFGRCRFYGSDDFVFDVDASVQIALQVNLGLNPESVGEDTLRLQPEVMVQAEVENYAYQTSVDGTLLSGVIESQINKSLEDLFAGEKVDAFVADAQQRAADLIANKWPDGELDLHIDRLSADQVADVYQTFSSRLGFVVSASYLNEHRAEILLALLERDTEDVGDGLLRSLACDASKAVAVNLPHYPLYREQGGGCAAIDPEQGGAGNYFSDAACSESVMFQPTGFDDECAVSMDKERFGNAAEIAGLPSYWTLNPGTRLDIGLESIAGNHQPYMTRRLYREVAGEKGICQLEMRVYSPSLDSKQLKPLLAFHGGSWRYRAAGYAGLEALVSHYTEEGFAVFAPFYRLTGEVDGNAACNGVDGDAILEDTQAALDWVQAHAVEFGVSESVLVKGVAVTGQSAGAYLAAWLAVHRSEAVSRALLLYAPTDFADYLRAVNGSESLIEAGKEAVEGLMGRPLDELAPDDPKVLAYSLPQQVENRAGSVPPLFLLQGMADTVVPASQSQRLCNALSGSADQGPAKLDGGDPAAGIFRQVYHCDDRSSELHLFAEAEHMFDVCPLGINCLVGGAESQALARDSLQKARTWLAADLDPQAEPGNESNPLTLAAEPKSSSGGGALGTEMLGIWLSAILWGARRRRLSGV
ncbi:MAG: alpha/beta hydrolase family protein [bacterium]